MLLSVGAAYVFSAISAASEPAGDVEGKFILQAGEQEQPEEDAAAELDAYCKNLKCTASVALLSTEDGSEKDYGEPVIYLQDLDETHAARILLDMENRNEDGRKVDAMILENGELFADIDGWALEPGSNPFYMDVTNVEGTGDCVYAFYVEGTLVSIVRIELRDAKSP